VKNTHYTTAELHTIYTENSENLIEIADTSMPLVLTFSTQNT